VTAAAAAAEATAAPRFHCRRSQPRVRYGYGAQFQRRGTVSSAGVDTQTSSNEESDEEVGEEEEESAVVF
jgi:hypothetical protein